MQGKRSIEVTVSPRGDILIDAVGFKGADCEKATRFLEEALGIAGPKQKKPEYHQRGTTAHVQKLGS
jgi:Protein of unknown function (DUF2997)